jgi:predicted nucleic acid-binding protein
MRALVIDTDAAIQIADRDAFEWLADRYVLLAPRLLWIETCSVLHRMMGRRRAFDGYEETMFERISAAPIALIDGYDRRAPWDIASLVGWQKTYDAEYLAAARHANAGIFTLDQRLSDGARRLGVAVVVPS